MPCIPRHSSAKSRNSSTTALSIQHLFPESVRRARLADSTGHRNTFTESLSGRLEAERLARPLVQLSGDRVELVL